MKKDGKVEPCVIWTKDGYQWNQRRPRILAVLSRLDGMQDSEALFKNAFAFAMARKIDSALNFGRMSHG